MQPYFTDLTPEIVLRLRTVLVRAYCSLDLNCVFLVEPLENLVLGSNLLDEYIKLPPSQRATHYTGFVDILREFDDFIAWLATQDGQAGLSRAMRGAKSKAVQEFVRVRQRLPNGIKRNRHDEG